MEVANEEIIGLDSEIKILERNVNEYTTELSTCINTLEIYQADLCTSRDLHDRAFNRFVELYAKLNEVKDELNRKRDEFKAKIVTSPIIWREEKEEEASLDSWCLHLVNRERAAEELLAIHESNHKRAEGADWIYGICASGSGWGKSNFAKEYLKILKHPPASLLSGQYSVLPLLQNAVRVHISLRKPDSKDSIEKVLLWQIKEALDRGTEARLDFHSFPSNIFKFMEALVRRSRRPIFLVIDEVTKPFIENKYWSEEMQADQLVRFNSFVENVIYRLVKIPGLFLLLCGRAAFLNWVGTKPRDPKLYIDGKIYGYRIALDLIYPKKIVDVLTKTVVLDNSDRVTLAKFLNLEGPEDRLIAYADQIYQVSLGHPRSLCRILLDRCKAIRDKSIKVRDRPRFFCSNEATNVSDWIVDFAGYLFPTKIASLLKAFKEKETYFDIDEIVNERAHLRHVISAIFISIEKLDDNCYQLHIPDRVQLILQAIVGSSRDFLSCVSHLRVLPTDFHYFFELLITKKFNQVFSLRKRLGQIDPYFLGSPVLGNWENLPSSDELKMFPSVTHRCYDKDEVGHLTIEPENAKSIIFLNITPRGAWLLPRRQSKSASLVYLYEKTILFITVKTSNAYLNDEIESAERMVPGCSGEYRAILIVASCTGFHQEIQGRFDGSGYQVYKAEKNLEKLDEVVLLDLSSPEMRAKFIDTGSLEEIAIIEWIVKQEPPPPREYYW